MTRFRSHAPVFVLCGLEIAGIWYCCSGWAANLLGLQYARQGHDEWSQL